MELLGSQYIIDTPKIPQIQITTTHQKILKMVKITNVVIKLEKGF
jgi:hypothetical protein